jgi:hypothetical protein
MPLPESLTTETITVVVYTSQNEKPYLPVAAQAEEELNLAPDPTEIALIRERINKLSLVPALSVEDALKEGARRAHAEKADPTLRSLSKFHGVLKNSQVWNGDAVEIIRRMRDEWDDPWGETHG